MPISLPQGPPPHVRPLLEALLEPRRCLAFDAPTWDRVLRVARQARLLGVLAARVAAVASQDAFEDTVCRHLRAAEVETQFRSQKTRYLLASIEPHLGGSETPRVLLKGAAYILQALPMAEGRLPSDVDLMVPRAALERIEHTLRQAGWQFEKDDPYDQRFYRDWSHELPPMTCPGQSLELDLHHTILPPLGRLKPDTQALFAAAVPIAGTPFKALCPADQVLLAAAHLFHDSDCTDRLRDLVDIDALVRHFAAADAGFWPQLIERARLHHLERPLWYALAFAQSWMATPIPHDAAAAIGTFEPRLARLACALMARTLAPVDPDLEPTPLRRWASRALEGRAYWLRMPPSLLLFHTAHKVAGAVRRKPALQSADGAAQ